LEIAELLAHTPKQTATREEIEKSELRVVKASELSTSAEGEVMENCVEKCLICLDDYEEDSEVRILGCRHAFHRDCVDYWLEKGRTIVLLAELR
jgi:hypothetical protein